MGGKRANLITFVVLGVLFVALFGALVYAKKSNAPQPSAVPGPAPCAGALESGTVSPQWQGVLVLQDLKNDDAALKAATRVLQSTGRLPQQQAACTRVLTLFSPADTDPWYEVVATRFKTVWWLLALAFALLFAWAGIRVQSPRRRQVARYPPVRVTLEDAREGATGQTIGSRFTATLHAQMLQLNPEQLGSSVITVADASDAMTSSLPVDELPSQAQWFVKLAQWFGARNHLAAQFTLASTRPGRVCVVAAIVEPNGNLTTSVEDKELREVIERRAGADPVASDYLKLTPAAFAWLLFHVKEVLGESGSMRKEVGTSSWEAYARFLEGAAALRSGDSAAAHAHFRQSRNLDESEEFIERWLNDAFAYMRDDDPDDWEYAYLLLEALVPLDS